mgnify:CR=1 FL=1
MENLLLACALEAFRNEFDNDEKFLNLWNDLSSNCQLFFTVGVHKVYVHRLIDVAFSKYGPIRHQIYKKPTSYVLDQNGTQLFLTLTPDEESLISNTGAQKIDLGKAGQKINISNTFLIAFHT